MAEQTPDSIITTQRNGQTIVAELFFNHRAAQKHYATSCSNWCLPTVRVYPRLTVKSRKKQKSCDNSRPDEPFPVRAVPI